MIVEYKVQAEVALISGHLTANGRDKTSNSRLQGVSLKELCTWTL